MNTDLLIHSVLGKLITLVVIATSLVHQFSRFLQLPFSGEAYPTWVSAAAKISTGGMEKPYSQLYT